MTPHLPGPTQSQHPCLRSNRNRRRAPKRGTEQVYLKSWETPPEKANPPTLLIHLSFDLLLGRWTQLRHTWDSPALSSPPRNVRTKHCASQASLRIPRFTRSKALPNVRCTIVLETTKTEKMPPQSL